MVEAPEKKQIDAILAWAMNQSPVKDCVDEAKLAGYGLAMLRCYYAGACPDESLRESCLKYAGLVVNRRLRVA
jgi:hypothetical protein